MVETISCNLRAAIVVVAVAVTAAPAANAQADSDTVVEEVRRAALAFRAAIAGRDGMLLARTLAADFAFVHTDGGIDDRQTFLAKALSGSLTIQSYPHEEYDDMVRPMGPNAAIRSLRAQVKLRRGDSAREIWLRGVQAFERRERAWQLVRHQSTLIYEGPVYTGAIDMQLVGTYDLSNGMQLGIRADSGNLIVRLPNGSELPLIPIALDRFHVSRDDELEVMRDSAGDIVGVRMLRPGREAWRATRRRTPPGESSDISHEMVSRQNGPEST